MSVLHATYSRKVDRSTPGPSCTMRLMVLPPPPPTPTTLITHGLCAGGETAACGVSGGGSAIIVTSDDAARAPTPANGITGRTTPRRASSVYRMAANLPTDRRLQAAGEDVPDDFEQAPNLPPWE